MENYTKGISRKNVKVPDLETFDCPGHISEFRAFCSLYVEKKCFLVAHCLFGNPSCLLLVVINVIKKMLITIIRVFKIGIHPCLNEQAEAAVHVSCLTFSFGGVRSNGEISCRVHRRQSAHGRIYGCQPSELSSSVCLGGTDWILASGGISITCPFQLNILY